MFSSSLRKLSYRVENALTMRKKTKLQIFFSILICDFGGYLI